MAKKETTRKGWIRRIIELIVVNAVITLVLVALAFLLGWGSLSSGLPALSGWHEQAPASEFRAENATASYTFDDYLKQENRIFEELAAFEKGPWSKEETGPFCRFNLTSICNPATLLDRDWNRTFVMDSQRPEGAIGGALLLHGLSDSPYSLRVMAERLHTQGWTVVGLRIPGHGTCPKALAEVSYKDWIAAVHVAAKGLRAKLPKDAPMILVGFSNGGALSVDYASAAVEDSSLPAPDGVMLFSPMIGITPMARLSQLYQVVELIPGFEKAAWQGIGAEIDPYKYSSWPMNASVQAWRLTTRVEERLARLQSRGEMGRMAPVLAFQSAVDSTVEVPVLIRRLFDRTTDDRSELVLFDVNRVTVLDDLLKLGFENKIVPLLDREDLPFVLTLVTNKNPNALDVVARRRAGTSLDVTDLNMKWPTHIFSLSHVAMPITPDDPVYGTEEATRATGLPLGSLDLRGETGVLRISEKLMFRQRYNPFYAYAQERADAWTGAIAKAH